MKTVLETRGLSHTYSPGTPFEKKAIDDISVRLYEGEQIAIIGHTGSGKSTFIQHLNGLLNPSSGKVLYKGEDVFGSKEKTHSLRFNVGLVFQYPEYQLFEETVFKDIAFGPSNMKLDAKEIDERVREAASFVGIDEDLFEKSPLELSGGQKRRVAIAGVIAMRPSVLILDEPTAGLDPSGRADILNNIKLYGDRTGSTIILVTHNMDDAADFADRLLVFSKGKIINDGKSSDVFSDAEFLGSIGLDIPKPTEIAAKLREGGLKLPSHIYTLQALKTEILRLKKGGAELV